MKVTSTHTGQVVHLHELVRDGAVVEKINDHLFRVEIPARNEVGPIGSLWKAEPKKK